MANSDKNIVIRPSIGSTTEQPSITFTGAGNSSITLKVLDDTQGTLSFEGSQGQVFSINNNLSSGIIYSVNDISGIPIIDADINANVRLSHYGGNVGVGTTNPRYKLEVGAVGTSGTSLWVNNNARITGSLAVGSLSGVGLTSLSDVNTGINTLVDGRALIYQGGQWIGGPIIGGFNYSTGDPYINNVITLLHMDGANGSTNFYDHSPSAVVYNRYGSVAISTSQSKFGGASGYFNGTGSIYISNPNTVFGQITGDFTLECWVYWVSTPPGNANGLERTIIGQTNWPESASGNWWWFYGLSTGFGWSVYNGGSGEGVGYNFTWQANRWYHLAVSRSNGTAYLFLDGTLVGSAPSTKPMFVDNVREFSIGGDSGGNSTLCNAYIEEVRFTKGIGRYTTSFTPQTIAFPNPFDVDYSKVSLLLHMDGANNSTTFTDSSPNALTVSVFGGAKISTAQSKFRGASGLFNGSTDYLTVPYSSLFEIGSGDVTIECWVYVTSAPSNAYDIATTNQAVSGNGWGLRLGSNMRPLFIFNTGGNTGYTEVTATSAISLNTWTHLAGVRYGNNIYIYVNGVSANTPTAVSGTQYSTFTGLSIGRNATNASWYYAGYIDELRVTKGLARYTSNFSVPTAPFPDQVGVSSSLPYSINNLDDVDTSTVAPIDGQSLAWNSLTNQWVPRTVGLGTTSSINTTGIITASSFSGNGSGLTNVRASYASTAGIATYANTSGVSTYSSVSGISTNVIGGIGSVTQLAVSGISSLGIVTALRYYGDGEFLDNIYRFSASSSPPSNPSLGDDWFNLDTGVLYKYINDNDNNFWYDTSDRPFNLTISQESAPVGFGVTLIDFFGAEIVTSPLSGIATITVSSQVILPTGDYGNLDPLPELDAFGIEISQSYDALVDPPESLAINDLGQL